MRPELIAVDLDGTLLRDDLTVSERTRAALAAAAAAGIPVLPVTARSPRSTGPLTEGLGLAGPAVCMNGALVFELEEQVMRHHAPIEPPLGRELVEEVSEALPGSVFAAEIALRFHLEPDYFTEYPVPEDAVHASATDWADQPLTKLVVRHRDLDVADLCERVTGIVGDRATSTRSGTSFAEIMAPGVSKATGVAWVCAQRGIEPQDVLAFGDMPNDIPLLSWAGWGVAMGSAPSDVQGAADEVTSVSHDDGVAEVVERVLAEIR